MWAEVSGFPGILQTFWVRLELPRHMASWTEKLQGSQPLQGEGDFAGL